MAFSSRPKKAEYSYRREQSSAWWSDIELCIAENVLDKLWNNKNSKTISNRDGPRSDALTKNPAGLRKVRCGFSINAGGWNPRREAFLPPFKEIPCSAPLSNGVWSLERAEWVGHGILWEEDMVGSQTWVPFCSSHCVHVQKDAPAASYGVQYFERHEKSHLSQKLRSVRLLVYQMTSQGWLLITYFWGNVVYGSLKREIVRFRGNCLMY